MIYNAERGEVVAYVINRSLDEDMELDVDFEGFENYQLVEHVELYSDDLKAINDKDAERVSPISIPINSDETVRLKKHSWNMLRYKL